MKITEEQRLKRNEYMRQWNAKHRESVSILQKRYRLNNPEKVAAQQKAKYERWKREKPEELRELNKKAQIKYALKKVWLLPENKEKNIIRGREWRLNHPGETTKRVAEWRKLHPEEAKENRRKWNRENSEKNKISHLNNKIKREKCDGKFTVKEWIEKKKEYNFTCPACGKKEPDIKLSVDHINPLILGGTNYIENIQPLCIPCNSRKNGKYIKYTVWSTIDMHTPPIISKSLYN